MTAENTPPNADEIRSMLVEMTHVTSMMHARADEALGAVGQNLLRFQILGIYVAEPTTVSNAARTLLVSRQYVQRVTDDLSGTGQVTRVDNPSHRRSPLFQASTEGRELFAASEASLGPWISHLGATIERGRLNRLRDALDILRRAATTFEQPGDAAGGQAP